MCVWNERMGFRGKKLTSWHIWAENGRRWGEAGSVCVCFIQYTMGFHTFSHTISLAHSLLSFLLSPLPFSIYQSIYLSIYLSVYLSFYLSINQSTWDLISYCEGMAKVLKITTHEQISTLTQGRCQCDANMYIYACLSTYIE